MDNAQSLEPIRIFIGSSIKNVVEQKVYAYTLKNHTQHPIDFNIIDGLNGSVTSLTTGEVKELPSELTHYIPGATAFTLARWAIPEWCGYQGKAIYCDSDQLSMSDIADLWNFDLEGHIAAAVPVKQAKCYPHYVRHHLKDYLASSDEHYFVSVMLLDCEKASIWSLESLLKLIEAKKFSLTDLMNFSAPFRKHFNLEIKTLPSEWNHLDVAYPDSKIVHFTNLSTQPWRFHHNAISELWDNLFFEAYDRGEVLRSDIVRAHELGRLTERHKVVSTLPKGIRLLANRLWRIPVGAVVLFFRFFKEAIEAVIPKVRSRIKRLIVAQPQPDV